MTFSVGSKLVEFAFLTKINNKIIEISFNDLFMNKTVALFGMPGAFTPTCSKLHLPSITDALDSLIMKGVDTVAILTTNDPHVNSKWGKLNKLDPKDVILLSDVDARFTEASGMLFSAPESGLIRRSNRYALIAENGMIKSLNVELSRGVCDISSGENLVKATNW